MERPCTRSLWGLATDLSGSSLRLNCFEGGGIDGSGSISIDSPIDSCGCCSRSRWENLGRVGSLIIASEGLSTGPDGAVVTACMLASKSKGSASDMSSGEAVDASTTRQLLESLMATLSNRN